MNLNDVKRYCITHVECGNPEFILAENHREALTIVNPAFRYSFESNGPGTNEWPEFDNAESFESRGLLHFSRSTVAEDTIDRYNHGRVSQDYPPRVGEVLIVIADDSEDSFYVYEVKR